MSTPVCLRRAAELVYPVQDCSDIDLLSNCALAGMLDDRAVGNRVGKRHTQFDQVGASIDQCMHERDRRIRMRIAGGHEGYESLASAALECGEAFVDPAHHNGYLRVRR